MGADGTLSQTIATTAGQTYTLSFWLQNEAAGTNDFKAIWNGQTLLSLTNAAQSGYTEYTYTVTATSSTTTLEFSAANGPSQWDLDNISLTANAQRVHVSSVVASAPASPPGRRSQRRQDGDADAQHERGGDGKAGGTPTLTLNDGGTATYTGGSGTSALTFSYTVAAGQNTADLAVTAVNLNGGDHHRWRRQCRQPVAGAATNPAGTLQIDTTTPTVSSVATSGTGITAGAATSMPARRGHADAQP